MRTIQMFSHWYILSFQIFASLLLVLLMLGYIGSGTPPEAKTVIVTILTLILASIGWVAGRVFSQIERRAKVEILELLSDSQPRTAEEITSLMRFKGLAFQSYEPIDAIGDLLFDKHLQLIDGKYSLAQNPDAPTKKRAKTSSTNAGKLGDS